MEAGGMRSAARGGVQHPLPLTARGMPCAEEEEGCDQAGMLLLKPVLLGHRRERSGSAPGGGGSARAAPAPAVPTRQDLSLPGHLGLSCLICRAFFLGALGSMLFYVSTRVLKVTRGVVCRARTKSLFLRQAAGM